MELKKAFTSVCLWLMYSNTFFCRKPKLDPSLNVGKTESLLDSSVSKHKLAVKPKKNHQSSLRRSVSPQPPQYQPKPNEK